MALKELLFHRIRSAALAGGVALGVFGSPALALASPAPAVPEAPVQVTSQAADGSNELAELAAREQASTELESFQGGEAVVIIGGSVLTLGLLILILALLID